MSQSSLSTRGRSLADEMTEQICSNSTKLEAVEQACPNWRENIEYAMGQHEEGEITEALMNVRANRARLESARTVIIESLDRQATTLEVFEDALLSSAARLADGPSPSSKAGFFLSQHQDNESIQSLSSPVKD